MSDVKQPVVRIDRSPMNAQRWCLELACGHEKWVTARRRPAIPAKPLRCERCSASRGAAKDAGTP